MTSIVRRFVAVASSLTIVCTAQASIHASGNHITEPYPVRGTVVQTFDAAGNALTRTDARSITATFSYDALNRLTSVSCPDPAENVSLTWDSCAGGVGRLCAVSDASGIRAWTYEGFGRVESETWTVGGHAFTTSYAWNPNDSLTSITYPSGRVVSFSRNVLSQITAVASAGANIVSARSYRSDGLLKAQSFGNGLVESRSYDLQGRMTGWDIGAVDSRSYTYDAAGNMTAIGSSSFAYDALDRLTSAPGASFLYDANGNRLADSAGVYSYAPASNRMASSPAGAVALDAAGNTTAIGSMSFAYNQAGRMASASISGTPVAQYGYSFKGHRTWKTESGETTVFHYDLAGNLIAESNSSGATIREYVWDDDGRPLAQIAGGVTTFLHADYLGTPRFGTDNSGVIVWTWPDIPFGTGSPTGGATVNLRYPGQYFDAETGLHQNWQRYLESDPGCIIGRNGQQNRTVPPSPSPVPGRHHHADPRA